MIGEGIKRLGVLGGSFDPVHLAHLLVAETVREALGLDLVLFVPVGIQPLKQDHPMTPAEDRVAMLELAIRDNPRFRLSRVDVDRAGPSYTVDTLRQLRAEWSLGRSTPRMWFILGADSLASFPLWREPAGILEQARLIVVGRPGVAWNMGKLEAQLPGLEEAIDWVAAPLVDISATEIRMLARVGRSLRYRVPEAVREYIEAHALYR